MLPRDNRLRDKILISTVFKSGNLTRTPFFNLYYKDISSPAQILVTISNKIEKRATKRNRLRRQIQEAFGEAMLSLGSSAKVIIVVRRGIVGKDYNDIKQELKKALDKNNT